MITMTVSLVPVHGTRLWTEPAFVPGGHARVVKPRPSVVTLAGIDVDNSTGMSAVRCRLR
ncbi:hypothetical protein GCM10017691_07490 [Pseudonocardia petroleophila]|uniref:Uncharacterized protein n=1 Tax=Pseudonocardia petroleophila TaxID=37331 RepID=A0A7G7MJS8_9PSEU|nr:hypothetical protein [Pseudonocardia petroleophila]QNG53039.1 hypothetical protein H6H00_03100 [Pseudonocardia petroleophila]